MQVGLNEAARLTGKDASTITRAGQAGRLSFSKDESGNRMFDLAESGRVYGPLRKPEEHPHLATTAAITEALERAHTAEVTGLQREMRRLEAQMRLLETQCSQLQEQANQLTRLPTDQRAQAERGRAWQERERGTPAQRLKFVFGGKAA